ncbi:MAG: TolC family protein, partial [Nitrospira sp.]|nr:TolC family protein [Nitrospira sp.]
MEQSGHALPGKLVEAVRRLMVGGERSKMNVLQSFLKPSCRRENDDRCGAGLNRCGRLVAATMVWVGILSAYVGVEAQESPRPAPSEEMQPVLNLSLTDAIEAALDKNPNVRLFRERVTAARAASSVHLGALLPNVSSVGRYNTQTFFLGTIGGAPVRTDPFEIVDGRASFTQSLFSVSLIERWRASRSAMQVAELDATTVEQDTVARVALSYYEVLRNQETLEARSANVAMYEELLAYVKSRQAGGVATGLDTARLESQLEHERQRLELARGEVERAKLALLNAIGIGYEATVRLTDRLKAYDGRIPSVEEAVELAGANRPELKAQLQRIRTAELSLRSIKGERLPSMSAEGNYGLIGNKFDNNTATYNVGVQLSVPIFDGGQRE